VHWFSQLRNLLPAISALLGTATIRKMQTHHKATDSNKQCNNTNTQTMKHHFIQKTKTMKQKLQINSLTQINITVKQLLQKQKTETKNQTINPSSNSRAFG
jgi:TolA-binding protein